MKDIQECEYVDNVKQNSNRQAYKQILKIH